MTFLGRTRNLVDKVLFRFGYELIRVRGRARVAEGVFSEDSLTTMRNLSFLGDVEFLRGYAAAVSTAGFDYQLRWRTHVVTWAARSCRELPGSFVELGTGRGWMMAAVLDSTDWGDQQRTAYLFDRFVDAPVNKITGEVMTGENKFRRYYAKNAQSVRKSFSKWPRVQLVEGSLPGSLAPALTGPIAFAHIDLNAAQPEIDSLELMWPMLSAGALVVLDDYAFPGHEAQQSAHDELARRLGYRILTLPTGQGLIIRR